MAAFCAGVLVFGSCSKDTKEAPREEPAASPEQSAPNAFIERATVVPDVVLKNVDGTTARLADYRGQIVIFIFWAPWNKDSVSQIPAMNATHNKFSGHNISLLGVAMGTKDIAELKNFIKESGIVFPVFSNGDEIMGRFGGTRRLPANYVVLRDGTVFDKSLGPRPARYFEDKIKAILRSRM